MRRALAIVAAALALSMTAAPAHADFWDDLLGPNPKRHVPRSKGGDCWFGCDVQPSQQSHRKPPPPPKIKIDFGKIDWDKCRFFCG